jgi:hypothetical protein
MLEGCLKVFIGWDSREIEAYEVTKFSLLRHSSIPLDIIPLKQAELRRQGVYWRPTDLAASTEFSLTRFLTPALAGFKGRALFMDSDFLWRGDVAELLAEAPTEAAVCCVKHDYKPQLGSKKDGALQEPYPRKNWSSLMLFDCAHPTIQSLTLEVVNQAQPSFLHRFAWIDDQQIGGLSAKWNWLEGWHSAAKGDPEPKAVHFTRGGPWMEQWKTVDYGDEWLQERERWRSAEGSS